MSESLNQSLNRFVQDYSLFRVHCVLFWDAQWSKALLEGWK